MKKESDRGLIQNKSKNSQNSAVKKQFNQEMDRM